ncbi:MAG: PEP-CTERM sorting domain-containing protein [Crocosphaera sp.]|nr:PEP-CTERM sorting domain-containing protein [Crocosphaera sp.]
MKLFAQSIITLSSVLVILSTVQSQAKATLFFNVTEDNGNTTVILTGINFTTSGLTSEDFLINIANTSINPSLGSINYSGATDTFTVLGSTFIIPTFSFGTGSTESAAFNLSPSNPFISLSGQNGKIHSSQSSPTPSNFVATATYAGTIASLGINTTPQTFIWSNGQEFRLFQDFPIESVPEPSTIIGFGILASLGVGTRIRYKLAKVKKK